ncbi:carbohydrate sulfotransferase 1-like [Styela clava]
MVYTHSKCKVLFGILVLSIILFLAMAWPRSSDHTISWKHNQPGLIQINAHLNTSKTKKKQSYGLNPDKNRSNATANARTQQGVTKQGTSTKFKRKAVVIFSAMRTGSTFFGEFFNRNPEIYYLFEPLHGLSEMNMANTRKLLLGDLLRCDYRIAPKIYSHGCGGWINCKSNICFAARSQFLLRNSKLCSDTSNKCNEYFDPRKLAKICLQSSYTAIKIVRMNSLGEFEELMTEPNIDLKVIQLVRDPRAVVLSQLKMEHSSNLTEYAENLCTFYHENFLYTKACIMSMYNKSNHENKAYKCNDTVKHLWKGRFLRLSHEYVSEQPVDALRTVEKFVGINHNSEVETWLRKNTHQSTKVIKLNKAGMPQNFFGTSRDSKQVLTKWRKQDFAVIDGIQNVCRSAMTELGYIAINTDAQLGNLSLSTYNFEKLLILPNNFRT